MFVVDYLNFLPYDPMPQEHLSPNRPRWRSSFAPHCNISDTAWFYAYCGACFTKNGKNTQCVLAFVRDNSSYPQYSRSTLHQCYGLPRLHIDVMGADLLYPAGEGCATKHTAELVPKFQISLPHLEETTCTLVNSQVSNYILGRWASNTHCLDSCVEIMAH